MIRTHGDNCKEPCPAELWHNIGFLEAELKKVNKELEQHKAICNCTLSVGEHK
jgi:hypothetical protein